MNNIFHIVNVSDFPPLLHIKGFLYVCFKISLTSEFFAIFRDNKTAKGK